AAVIGPHLTRHVARVLVAIDGDEIPVRFADTVDLVTSLGVGYRLRREVDQFIAVPYEPDDDARLALAGVGGRDHAANDLFRIGDDLNVGTGEDVPPVVQMVLAGIVKDGLVEWFGVEAGAVGDPHRGIGDAGAAQAEADRPLGAQAMDGETAVGIGLG